MENPPFEACVEPETPRFLGSLLGPKAPGGRARGRAIPYTGRFQHARPRQHQRLEARALRVASARQPRHGEARAALALQQQPLMKRRTQRRGPHLAAEGRGEMLRGFIESIECVLTKYTVYIINISYILFLHITISYIRTRSSCTQL